MRDAPDFGFSAAPKSRAGGPSVLGFRGGELGAGRAAETAAVCGKCHSAELERRFMATTADVLFARGRA